VYDGEQDKNLILNTQNWDSYPAKIEKGFLSFSPDESFLAGSGDSVQMAGVQVQGTSNTELTVAKCETYKKSGSGSIVSVCLQIWNVEWYGDQNLFFQHHPGLYDDSFVFPETMMEDTGVLAAKSSLGVVSVDGTLLQDMNFPYRLMDIIGETVLGAEFGNQPGFADTKYVWFEAADILNGKIIPHRITSPEGFSGKVALSPSGEFLFMSPNYLVDLRGTVSGPGKVTVFPYSGDGLISSCFWHPDGMYVACVGSKEKDIYIYSIMDQTTQTWLPDWLYFTLIAWVKE
jgi:WD40 repeat protein